MTAQIEDTAPAAAGNPLAVHLASPLAQGLAKLGIDLTNAQQQSLLDYLGLIAKWNKVYNLTAVREPQEMLTHHLLDSLAVVPPLRRYLAGRPARADQAIGKSAPAPKLVRLLDVGAGAGLPGVVIAICCPDVAVTCVDTVAKKATFIQQVAMTLRLPNLRSQHARVETIKGPYDVVTSRAFASLSDFTQWSSGALAADGVWMALKGKRPEAEIAQVTQAGQTAGMAGPAGPAGNVAVFHVEQLSVPGLDAERCIVWMQRKAAANAASA